MNLKCFFLGHKWKTKYSTERKDLCECEQCDAKAHYDKERKVYSRESGKLVRK